MKKILFALLWLGVVLVFPSFASAQATGSTKPDSCFNYYDYGQVKVYLSTDKNSFTTGQTAVFSGTINNFNKFPLRDVVLYGQIKRVNESDNFAENGHYLVDKMSFLNGLNLMPGEVKQVMFSLPIAQNYPAGDYQVQYFVFSKQGFNYAGRNFLEEDMAGVTNFTLSGSTDSNVYFDPNSLTVDEKSHRVREQLNKFPKGDHTISVTLAGNLSSAGAINGDLAFYSYDDALESNMVDTFRRFVLNDSNKFTLSTGVPQKSGAYVMVVRVESPVKSMFKYRFVIDGDDPSPLRMNDIGLTNYPPSVDDKAYLCFHSATDRETPVYKIRLAITDGQNKIVEEKILEGKFGPDVSVITIPMDKLVDRGVFNLKAELVSEALPEAKVSVDVSYSCDNFAASVRDIDLSYNPQSPESVTVAGRDGCGNSNRVGGVIDQIRVMKDGMVVKEDYNNELSGGQYSVGKLAAGNYTVEVKNGDKVKVLSINVPAKKNTAKLIIIWWILFFTLVSFVALYLRRKRVKGLRPD